MGIRELKNFECLGLVKACVKGGMAAGKSLKENFGNLTKVISGEKTVKEALKERKFVFVTMGATTGKSIRETTIHNFNVLKSVFD